MGPCSKRNFFLTVSSLQLITTTERQVFDFLGFMWVPILVNFFHIIYVILGFFGAYQYRPKYIIVYCLWNILWLLWNIFLVCFYLNAAGLDKNSDLLNFGTGSFSWWLSNGPGCKAILNNSVPEHSDMFRPLRPSRVTGCLIEYEVIEIIHSSILSILALMGIIGGICLTRLFLEEDDSFDFVGGNDFGMAGHTPLHPMYVSYSALSSPAYAQKHSTDNYPTGTTSTHRSTLNDSTIASRNDNKSKPLEIVNKPLPPAPPLVQRHQAIDSLRNSNRNIALKRNVEPVVDLGDYSNPLDHLQRPNSFNCDEYDSLEDSIRVRYQKNKSQNINSKYSPAPKNKALNSAAYKQNRNSCKPRMLADHIREEPLRSYHSDPRLDVEEQSLSRNNEVSRSRRDSRPLSMFVNNNY